MKKVHMILIFLLPLTVTLFDTQQYSITAANAAEGTLRSKCNSCELKEALKEGGWQKAVESAEQIIVTTPDSPEAADAYLWLGLYHKSKRDFGTSTDYYQTAAALFPNTWASAEAHARTGCNYYKLNNYSKALEYFRKAGAEAKTWQQRKYASTWAKWVHFALAGNEQQLVANCATKSINYYLGTKGIKLDKEKLASSLTLKDGLVPLSGILKFLNNENVKLKAVKCPFDRIKDLQLPFVAVVKPSHLIVVKDIQENGINKKIIVYDPVLGEISYYEKELADIWEEKILTMFTPSGRNWITFVLELACGRKFASLAQKELDNIYLGTCYCCPELPITTCDEDSDDCSSCNGAEAGGFGGNGWPGGGCGGGGCYAVGFPQMSVYTSSLTLIVRDTPIGYTTALGEDVKVSLTYNSDLSHSGVFGNGWHSNLETKIQENPPDNNSVIVTRSGGGTDTFTYSGGQYYPPVGVSNKLIKNQDGTFTLKYTKSHRKYHYNTHANGGKLLAIEDRNGNTLSYQYDANDNITSITDAVGRVTDIETDDAGRITGVTDPSGREAAFEYDINGNLTQVVDMAGNTFTYTYYYQSDNSMSSLTEPKGTHTILYGHNLIWVTDPNGNTYEYHGDSPTYARDPRGNYTYYYPDWYYGWPYYGDTVKIKDALENYVEYTYDDDRNKTEIRDKRGNTTYYTYDANNNVTSKTDPLENSWSYTHDANNNLISTTDPRGKITSYVYDSNSNLLSVTEKDPNETVLSVISYTYDANGLTTSMTANGNSTTYDYDPNGNLIQITDPEENITTFAYDVIGRKISMTNDANATTTYEYDDLDRITKITHPDSNYIQYTYNCCGLNQKRDENGKTTDYEYDSLGRLTTVTDAQENETIYTYDQVGNLVSLTDGKGNTTTYTYDALNRVIEITYPLGDSESYTYDEEGNMLTKTDGKGLTTGYTYDENNRLIKIVKIKGVCS